MVSNILYFHPYLGKWSNLTNTNIFQRGWFNHQLVIPFSACALSTEFSASKVLKKSKVTHTAVLQRDQTADIVSGFGVDSHYKHGWVSIITVPDFHYAYVILCIYALYRHVQCIFVCKLENASKTSWKSKMWVQHWFIHIIWWHKHGMIWIEVLHKLSTVGVVWIELLQAHTHACTLFVQLLRSTLVSFTVTVSWPVLDPRQICACNPS